MDGSGRPVVAVLCNSTSSADPAAIHRASAGLCDVVFAYDRHDPDVAGAAEAFAGLGPWCDITALSGPRAASELRQLGVGGLAAFSDVYLSRAAEIAGALGAPFLSLAAATAATDKSVQRALLAAAGVDVVRRAVVARSTAVPEAISQVGLPAVVKPVVGVSSRYTLLATTEAECADAVAAVLAAPTLDRSRPRAVVEELLTGDPRWTGPVWGDYVSVESVTAAGHTRHLAIGGKLPLLAPFRETGTFLPSTLDEDTQGAVYDLTDAALRALGIRDALSHTEVKLTPAGPRIIEVNARLGGAVANILHLAGGPDAVRLALLVALGRDDDIDLALAAWYDEYTAGVTYQRMIQGPPRRVRIRTVRGIAAVKALPGVHRIDIRSGPGDVLDPLADGTNALVAAIYGSAADHDDLATRLAAIDTLLTVECEEL